VGGAIDDGTENAPLVPELAGSFTIYNYARRGRGESGDTPPYAVERAIEDLEALTGGGLALEASAAGLEIDRLAVYEVPYSMDADGPHWNQRDVPEVEELLAQGRRGDVVELFMRTVGSSEEDISGRRPRRFDHRWRPSRTRSPTTPPSWETGHHLPTAWRGSPRRPWWPRARSQTPTAPCRGSS